jgi:2-polyprenyl-3-methyl-5-hydroxy-6-metoxy-1,4-benzoquinol methylase
VSADTAEHRSCWCGYPTLFDYSADYHVCKACGTLVSRAPVAKKNVTPGAAPQQGLYSEEYWLKRQREHHKLPDIYERARLDLPERCTYWLQHLLSVQLPPARVLELGCGHGGYLALLAWAGFKATGTEMSPWVVEFAKKTFAVDVRAGAVEEQRFATGSFDVIVLNDVIEHLERPAETLAYCSTLLSPQGFFVIQTPEYKEHLSYQELQATNDLFLRHMDGNNEEHLYLFSRRSAQNLFDRLGFGCVTFANPVYSYDMFFTAGRAPLPSHSKEEIWGALAGRPEGRLVQALLDKAYESADRWWAIQRLEGGRNERLKG